MAVINYTLRASGVPGGMVSDRQGYLYGVSGGNVIKYNAATGGSSNLGTPGTHISFLACYRGYVYAMWWNGTDVLSNVTAMGISYYNAGWQQVWTGPTMVGTFHQLGGLWALRDEVMVATVGCFDGGGFLDPVVIYTENGTTWLGGEVGGSSVTMLVKAAAGLGVLFGDTIYVQGNTDHLYVSPPYTAQIWRWNSNAFSIYKDPYGYTSPNTTYPRFRAGYVDKYWEAPSSGNTNYSDNLLGWTANPGTADGTITPVDGDNLPSSWGYFYNGVSFYMVPWDDDALDWLEVDYDIYSYATYGAPSKLYRMDDGKVFVVTGGGYLLQRNADIPESPQWHIVGFGYLYWGQNALTNSKALVI